MFYAAVLLKVPYTNWSIQRICTTSLFFQLNKDPRSNSSRVVFQPLPKRQNVGAHNRSTQHQESAKFHHATTSWWLNHPSEKYAHQIGIISPNFGVKIKDVWNHHLVQYWDHIRFHIQLFYVPFIFCSDSLTDLPIHLFINPSIHLYIYMSFSTSLSLFFSTQHHLDWLKKYWIKPTCVGTHFNLSPLTFSLGRKASKSSWWLNHPAERYERQIGSSPQVEVKNKKWNHHPWICMFDAWKKIK